MSPHNQESDQIDEINVLKLTLHGRLVGYLAGFQSGRNVLSFAAEFKDDPFRPTFSLITHPNFPNSVKLMSQLHIRTHHEHLILCIVNTDSYRT